MQQGKSNERQAVKRRHPYSKYRMIRMTKEEKKALEVRNREMAEEVAEKERDNKARAAREREEEMAREAAAAGQQGGTRKATKRRHPYTKERLI